MSCCCPTGYLKSQINGECEECGQPTVDGDAYEHCGYSPTVCELCGWAPCDLSC
jgi:hypothetical protein